MKLKRPFTLLEIMICLFLLAMMGSYAGIKGYELIKQSQITYAKKRLHEEFELSRCMALCYKMDVEVTLLKKKNKTHFIRTGDPPEQLAHLFDSPILLPLPIHEDKHFLIRPELE